MCLHTLLLLKIIFCMSLPEVLIFDGTRPPLLPPSSVLVSPTLSPSRLQLWSLRPTAPHSQCFSRPRPSGLTQPACCRLSAPPRPRGCFKITTIPLSLPCPFFHYWKTNKQRNKNKTKHSSMRSYTREHRPTSLLPHRHCHGSHGTG